jgi:hypothetical protein
MNILLYIRNRVGMGNHVAVSPEPAANYPVFLARLVLGGSGPNHANIAFQARGAERPRGIQASTCAFKTTHRENAVKHVSTRLKRGEESCVPDRLKTVGEGLRVDGTQGHIMTGLPTSGACCLQESRGM